MRTWVNKNAGLAPVDWTRVERPELYAYDLHSGGRQFDSDRVHQAI